MDDQHRAEASEMQAVRLRPGSFFVVRTPVLAGRAFAIADPGATFTQRSTELREFVASDPVRRVMGAASPSLLRALREHGDRTNEDASVFAPAMRYVERMRARSTPFGLCAGYSFGRTTAKTTALTLAPLSNYRCIFRLDVDALHAAVNSAASRGDLETSRLVTSGDVLRFGDTFKIARRRPDRTLSYADVARSEVLELLLERARSPTSFAELVSAVSPFADTAEEAAGYVEKVVEVGLLVLASTPSVSTDDELAALEGLTPYDTLAAAAKSIRDTPFTSDVTRELDAVSAELAPLRARDAGAFGIHDLVKPFAEGSLGSDVLGELGKLVAVLERLREPVEDRRFRLFCEYLATRFESREVPLVEALDPARGFNFPVEPDPAPSPRDIDRLRLVLHARALEAGAREVLLREEDLPELEEARKESSPAALRFCLAETPEGFSIHDLVGLGPPGTQLFARATAFSRELRDLCRAHLRIAAEALPDEDVADLAFFVPGKSAALVQFPNLQPFEIVLTTRSGVPEERRIDINDLLVSVRGERLVLRSRRTQRCVRVRAVGAVNADRADVTPLARFLFAYRNQEATSLGWRWGALAQAPFLPRVRFGRHVLVSARWNLDASQTKALRDAPTPEAAFVAAQDLRRTLDLPRHIVFHDEADYLLSVDLDDILSVHAWRDIARDRMAISEAFSFEASAVRGPEGRFHHEIVLPLLPPERKAKTLAAGSPSRGFDERMVFDRVTPGGPVLYLKLYGDRDELVPILAEVVRDALAEAEAHGRVSHWFFLPYADPDPHLRLRVFGAPEILYGHLLAVMRELLEPLVRKRTLHRFVLDTYERETVRYGGPVGLELAERVFWPSSEAAILFHDERPVAESGNTFVLTHLVHSHAALLETAGLGLSAAARQARFTATRYQRAQDPMAPRRRSGELLRQSRATLIELPGADALFGGPIASRFRAAFQELRRRSDEIFVPFEELCADCMHTHTLRHLTPWYPDADMEEVVYLTLAKTLTTAMALTGLPPRARGSR